MKWDCRPAGSITCGHGPAYCWGQTCILTPCSRTVLHTHKGCLSLMSLLEKNHYQIFEEFFQHLCNDLFLLLLTGETCAAEPGLPPALRTSATGQEELLRPPGSWAQPVSSQSSAKTKASHPVDVLTKVHLDQLWLISPSLQQRFSCHTGTWHFKGRASGLLFSWRC